MVEGFRMGHQPHHSPRGIADSGDVVQRAVGIVREGAVGGFPVRCGIAQNDLALLGEFPYHVGFGKKLAFPMSHRQLDWS